MAEVTTVSITAGIPTSGTGEVPTLAVVRDAILGSVADGGVAAGNPSRVAGTTVASLAGVTLDAAGRVASFNVDLDRTLVVRPYKLEDLVSGVSAAISGGASTVVIAAQAAGVKTYVTDAVVINTSATACTVDLRDGVAGTVKWTFQVPAGSAAHKTWDSPLPGSAATGWYAHPSASVTSVVASLSGFKSKI